MLIYVDSHNLSVKKEDRWTGASDPLAYSSYINPVFINVTPVYYRLRSKSTACSIGFLLGNFVYTILHDCNWNIAIVITEVFPHVLNKKIDESEWKWIKNQPTFSLYCSYWCFFTFWCRPCPQGSQGSPSEMCPIVSGYCHVHVTRIVGPSPHAVSLSKQKKLFCWSACQGWSIVT